MIEHAAPEPIAGYVVGVLIMDPAGASVFWSCFFAWDMTAAARWLQDFQLEDGYTVRDAFVAPAPVRIPAPRLRPRGLKLG